VRVIAPILAVERGFVVNASVIIEIEMSFPHVFSQIRLNGPMIEAWRILFRCGRRKRGYIDRGCLKKTSLSISLYLEIFLKERRIEKHFFKIEGN
jgi:hypothetical protein